MTSLAETFTTILSLVQLGLLFGIGYYIFKAFSGEVMGYGERTGAPISSTWDWGKKKWKEGQKKQEESQKDLEQLRTYQKQLAAFIAREDLEIIERIKLIQHLLEDLEKFARAIESGHTEGLQRGQLQRGQSP